MDAAFGTARRIFAACGAAAFIVAGTGSELRAQDDKVAIVVVEPTLLDPMKKKDLSEVTELVRISLDEALGEKFVTTTALNEAAYTVELKFVGPFLGCSWKVQCHWSKSSDPKKHECWDYTVPIPYCSIADMTQVSCLGKRLDFSSAETPSLTGDLCASTEENQSPVKFVTVYTSCLQFGVQDESWTKKVLRSTDQIPLQIEAELDSEFQHRGYDIVAARCPPDSGDAQSAAKNADLEIIGYIEEGKEANKVHVKLFVLMNNQLVSTKMREMIHGPTPEITRDNYRDLGKAVVDYIRERLRQDE